MDPAPGHPHAPAAARSTTARAALLLVALCVAYLWPLIHDVNTVGGELDWKYFQQLWEADATSVRTYGQFPFWNPWYCGGNPQLANPQTQFLSPAGWLGPLLGVAVAIKLHILLHFVLGALGMLAWARSAGLSVPAATASAGTWVLCGFFAMRAGGGHSAFLPFLFMPWAALGWDVSRRYVPAALGTGLCMALMLLGGGMYAFALTGGMLATMAAWDVATRRVHVRSAAASLGVTVLTALAGAAVKLGPVLEFIREFPREVPVKDRLGPLRVVSMWLSPATGRSCEDCVYVWPEYAQFLGPVVVGLFVAGAWMAFREPRWRRAYVVSAVACAVMVGDWGALAPYRLLHHVPPYDSLRVPARWGIIISLCMALVAGAVLDRAVAWLRGRNPGVARHARWAWAVLILLTWSAPFVHNRWHWSAGFRERIPDVVQEPFRQERGGAWDAWNATRRNVGTTECYENVQVQRAKGLRLGRVAQAWVSAGQGEVALARFTPNAWTLDVQMATDGVVALNMNHHRPWAVTRGSGEVINVDGLLSVKVPAGTQQLEVTYRPSGFAGFALLSAATWLGALAWLWRRGKEVLSAMTDSPPKPDETPPAPPVAEAASSSESPASEIATSLRIVLGSAWPAALVVGVAFGCVQLVDLFARRLAPGDGNAAFILAGLLVEGGAAALLAGAGVVVLRAVAWRGHAVGRAWSTPVRWMLGMDGNGGPDAFARTGGVLVGVLAWLAAVTGAGAWAARAFNARELAAALVAVLALLAVPLCGLLGSVVGVALRALVEGPLRGVATGGPARGVTPWAVLVAASTAAGIRAAAPVLKETDLRPALYPLGVALFAVALSFHAEGPVTRFPRLARAAFAAILGMLLVGGGVLGSAPRLMERGMLAAPLARVVKRAWDRDRDGHSPVLGGGDCDDGNAARFPGAMDIPGNGVDEDCSGEDFTVKPRAPGEHHAALPAGTEPYKNVLLVVVDTLRRDRMSLYGNTRPTTPFMEQLGRESAVFDQAYANGVRSHRSIPSILTGRYPSRLHMAEGSTELMTLLPGNTTLAERLTPRGYGAAAFILEKYFEGQQGLTQGFDFFNPRRVDPAYRDWSRPQGEAVVNAAARWITAQEGRPWLAWTHLYDPHLYWHDTPFGADPVARYDAAVRYVDAQVQRLVEFIRAQPDGHRTVIIITADHGQGLGTHGEWGHGQQLWQEDIHVPLIIHAPGLPAQRVRRVVQNVDIVPTVLNLLGMSGALDAALDGRTLVPALVGGDAALTETPAFVDGLTDKLQPRNRRAVVAWPHKLVVDLDAGTRALFDLEQDAAEKKDLSASQPGAADALRAMLDEHTALSAYELARTR